MTDLTLISFPHFFDGEAAALNQLLDMQEFTLHLRKPGALKDNYHHLLEKIEAKYYSRIIIHDYPELKDQFLLKGTHFSAKQRPEQTIGFVGTSCHSIEELKELDGKYNYLYISPVFQSISKKGYSSDLDLITLKNYLSSNPRSRIIALGGVDESKIQLLVELGFYHVAVLGTVWSEKSILEGTFCKHLEKITRCLKSVHIA